MNETTAQARPEADRGDELAPAIVWLTLGLVGLQTAAGAVNALSLESSLLDPNDEESVFQPLNAAFTAAAGAAAAFRAVRRSEQRARYAVLAVVLLAFAADDMLVVHERLGEAAGEALGLPDHLAVRMWIALLLPLLAAAFVILVAETMHLRGRVQRLLAAGLAALVAAVVVEVAGAVTRDPAFIERLGGKPETLRLLVEEGLELGGWVLVAGALWIAVAIPSARNGSAGTGPPGRPTARRGGTG